MPYVKLSDQIKKMHNPQRSDSFVKQLRTSVREGDVTAADLPSRFELPKKYAKRGSDITYTRSVKDMVIDATPKFEVWFEKVNKELSPARSGGKVKVSVEAIEAGLVDFKTLAAETRKKMGASFSKGQALGKTRPGKAKTPAKKTKK